MTTKVRSLNAPLRARKHIDKLNTVDNNRKNPVVLRSCPHLLQPFVFYAKGHVIPRAKPFVRTTVLANGIALPRNLKFGRKENNADGLSK